MRGEPPVLLTERDWQWWFGVDGLEAVRLVHVQRTLLAAGLDPCPDTVLGMSRAVFVDHLAPVRLRLLADLWDREPAPVVDRDRGWPFVGELPDLQLEPSSASNTYRVDGRRPRLCRRHGWPRRKDE